jgi:hypothetical protein
MSILTLASPCISLSGDWNGHQRRQVLEGFLMSFTHRPPFFPYFCIIFPISSYATSFLF